MIKIENISGFDYRDVYHLAGKIDGIVQHPAHVYKIMAAHFTDTFYIAREESGSGKSTILGFMMGFVSQSYPGHLFVWQIAVSEAAQGKGVGKKLLRHTVDFAKQSDSCSAVMATVETTNIGSQALFEKSGFSIDSARFKDVGLELITNDGKEAVVDYYGSGTDQIFYVLKV